MIFSTQPPFYPSEAEAKGAKPAQVQKKQKKNLIAKLLTLIFMFPSEHVT